MLDRIIIYNMEFSFKVSGIGGGFNKKGGWH